MSQKSFRTAKIDVENLQEINADWRNKESKSLSNLVQKRLEYLQVCLFVTKLLKLVHLLQIC